jgi:mono/diheme cytochrome c family protein
MKKFLIVAGCIALGAVMTGCGGANGEDPGESYMPDMYYARAYEAYGYNNVEGEFDSLQRRGIRYTAMPVPGTMARGDQNSFHLTGDSAGLRAAQGLRNPLDADSTLRGYYDIKEAERLYLVNCGICHGDKLDGNGPLWNNGNGAYPAMPRPLNIPETKIPAMTEGHYFHVITFGKGSMGSYASQLRPEQRWAVIKYIRTRQGGAETPANLTGVGNATQDSTGAKLPAEGLQNQNDTKANRLVEPQKN